ncbi:something about silencing protein 10 isoform X2 [Agrilus planipennis]|uniref:Something about silencing protein 10 isoform X2 n=1 Tax=Agrilus planipennis TaxID=224129 RepID=A0A7F5RGS9_AGRPL|nr:something about silencing protein 10 isoform X2 [Agrilus planipennis]
MSGQHIRYDESDDCFYSSDNDEDLQIDAPEKNTSDDREEVFGIYSDNESSDIAMSDVEEQEDNDIPDIRAWGKGKKKYYSTDYVDKDYNTSHGKDALLADIEEEEAKQLQLQLVQQLQDTDFHFDMLPKCKEDTTKFEETVITDVSNLTKRQKMDIFRADAPEFFGLIGDSKEKFSTIKNILKLLKNNFTTNGVNESGALEFLYKHLQLILNYLVNIGIYLLLKSQKAAIKTHPVIKRIYQYRQLLNKMDHVFLQLGSQEIGIIPSEFQETQNQLGCNRKSAQDLRTQPKENIVGNNQLSILVKSKANTDGVAELKRPISYQIAKNKGLLPHRKKEQRNPRVKNRMKYRKAKIRRKGAVREVRKELVRYSGEISGIKATVKKSISIKS